MNLPLFRVLSADTRQVAQALACNQEIAAEGAFAVAMVAELPAGEHDHLHTTVLAAPSHDAPAAFQCWSRKAGSAGAARTAVGLATAGFARALPLRAPPAARPTRGMASSVK